MAKIISPEKTAFLKFELENGGSRRKKVALQDISRLYRRGEILNAEGRNAFEKIINGMVLSDSDAKVVRWCLNALARLGTRSGSSTYIEFALKQHGNTPEIVAAAVAALARMYNGQLEIAPGLSSVDPAVQILAALQTTEAKNLDLANFKIDVDKADVELLKLALITVGLNKDIENLFDPRHSNGEIVRALGQHDDVIVRQYSVWSVIENRRLTIADLGIPFSNIDKEPPNVQAKLLQLAVEQEPNKKLRHGIILAGSLNEHSDSREGLAKGLLSTHYDGLEEITLCWFDNESNGGVKNLLAEHFARFSDVCQPYEDKALAIVEAEPSLKSRILLGAEGRRLYGLIKASDIREGTADLFGSAGDLTNMFSKGHLLQAGRKEMKILFLAASPKNSQPLRLDQEARDLREQIKLVKDAKLDVKIEHRWAVRTDQVQMEILNEKPSVLHFSGHGNVDVLVFEDVTGKSMAVSAKAFAELISLSPGVECVVLNACFSETVAKLVSPHVRAVIGCDVSIDDNAAIVFTRAFYRAVVHGFDFMEAFNLAKNDVRLNSGDSEADKYVIYYN